MALPANVRRFFLICGVAFVLVTGTFSVLHRIYSTRTSVTLGTGKAAIHDYLTKQSGQIEFKPNFDFDLASRVGVLRSNANVLEQHTAAIRAAMRAGAERTEPLRREVDALRAETLRFKKAVIESKDKLRTAQTRVSPKESEIAVAQAECEKNDGAWKAKREELSIKEAQLETTTDERRLQPQLTEAKRQEDTARQELRPLEEQLARQENAFIGAMRQKAGEARTYETIYRLIGEQLAVADKLLADPHRERRQIGLSFAREACGHTSAHAENGWLAARICEAYLWPNVDLADYAAGSKEHAQDILHRCKAVFLAVGENGNVVRNYELMIKHAPDLRMADALRLELSDLLQQIGDDTRAIKALQEITESNVVKTAEEKIARIQRRLTSGR